MFKEKDLWLVDVGSTHLKLLNLRWGKHPYIVTVKVVPYYQTGLVNRPEDLSQLILTQILKDTVRTLKINGKPIRALISSPGALVRNLTLPLISATDLKSAIQFNLLGLLPYNPEQAEFDFTIWETTTGEQSQSVIVGVAPQAEIDWLSAILKRAGLEPILITIDALAIYNALQFFQSDWDQPTLFLHIGARRTVLLYWQDNQTPFFHTIPLGAEHITQRLAALLSTSYTNAELLKCGEFPFPESRKEHEQVYYHALKQALLLPLIPIIQDIIINQRLNYPTSPFEQVVLTGGGALTHDLDYLLSRAINLPVKKWNPLEHLPEHLYKSQPPLDYGWQLVPILGLAFQEGLCV